MEEQDPQRRAALYRLDRLVHDDDPDAPVAAQGLPATPTEPGTVPAPVPAPRPRSMAARGAFADELVRQAMARGEFDDLPLAGKPIPGLGSRYDPDWWLKAFIEREQITGVLPEALQLRKDDAVLDDRLDAEHHEAQVRDAVQEFNARVVAARRQLLGGPPVVTPTRDVETEVVRWHARRRERQEASVRAAEAVRAQLRDERAARRRGRWWRPRRAAPTDHPTDPRPARPDRGAPRA